MVTGRPCLFCGESIQRHWPHELKSATFCNNTCKHSYQKTHPTNYHGSKQTDHCKMCGKQFTYYPSVRPNAQYCSNECRHLDHGSKVCGSKGGRWKGAARGKTSIRLFAKRWLPQQCAICGWHAASCDAHHIVPLKSGGENILSNMIILCPNHHRMVEEGLLSSTQLFETWEQNYAGLELDQSLFG